MPNRHANTGGYRYGFNGKEMDDEIKGEGNSYDYGSRMLDPRVGRWFTIDPKFYMFAGYSPYNYAINSPLSNIDTDGEIVRPVHREYSQQNGIGEDTNLTFVETEGFVYERTQKALEHYMKTSEGRNYVKMYLKKGETIGGYTATEDGVFYDAILTLTETNLIESGAFASTYDTFTVVDGGVTKSNIQTNYIKYGIFSDQASKKFLKNKVKSIDSEITFNPLMFDNYSLESENVLDLAQTVGHESFLHAFNKAVLANFMLNAGHFDVALDLLQRESGERGDIDHSNYINDNIDGFGTNGVSIYKKFIKSLKKSSGNEKAVDKIEKAHKEKYKHLENKENVKNGG